MCLEEAMIEHTIRINYLLDFYKILLTEKQKFALEMYYQEDLSLVEIAQNLDVSRQAIYDLLKRGENILEEYEDKPEEKEFQGLTDEELQEILNN